MSIYKYNEKIDKKFSSEISQSNILDYKRRSKIVSSHYCINTKKTIVNSIETLKNFYNTLFDFKNILTDYIDIAKTQKRFFNSNEENYLRSLITSTKTELHSAYYIYCKKNTKLKREEKKLMKNIDDIGLVLVLLYKDIDEYFRI
jgi:hypothetical protein